MNTTIANLQRLIPQVQESLEKLQTLLDATQGNERAKYKLIVTMHDGEKIQEKKPSDTFVSVIEKIGIERVENLKIIAVGAASPNRDTPLPLIADYRDPHTQRKLGRYFIAMGSSTRQKAKWLKEIADRLNLKMEVEVKAVNKEGEPSD